MTENELFMRQVVLFFFFFFFLVCYFDNILAELISTTMGVSRGMIIKK